MSRPRVSGQPTVLSNVLGATIKTGQEFIYALHPSSIILWKNVESIQVEILGAKITIPAGTNVDWSLAHLRITTNGPSGKWVMFDKDNPGTILDERSLRFPVLAFTPPISNVDDLLSDQKSFAV